MTTSASTALELGTSVTALPVIDSIRLFRDA